jgi:hypothetical protein
MYCDLANRLESENKGLSAAHIRDQIKWNNLPDKLNASSYANLYMNMLRIM